MANMSDALVFIRVLENSTQIRLTQVNLSILTNNFFLNRYYRYFQLISNIIAFFCWSAGFIYLLENQGDPFHDYENAREKGEFRFEACFIYNFDLQMRKKTQTKWKS